MPKYPTWAKLCLHDKTVLHKLSIYVKRANYRNDFILDKGEREASLKHLRRCEKQAPQRSKTTDLSPR
jgi:hypothetical protein